MEMPTRTHRANRDGAAPCPFTIEISDTILDDLRACLSRTRWPDQIDGSGWEYGTDRSYLRELCAHWRERYDWRAQEAALNGFRQFTVRVGGIDLHFIHELGEGPNPRPLLLSHGWPGSFFEYHRLIPRLTHPSRYGGSAEDSFSVVVPSLPGHGFSFTPGQRRFGIGEIADCLGTLMVDVLGYDSFMAHGHDWGAFISTRLGYTHAEQVSGIHITLLAIPRRPTPPRTPDETRFQQQLEIWQREENGYSQIMGTRPQTLAYALTDSPTGLAAWIVEKFRRWSDSAGDVDAHFGKDTLLTNIMLYWVTGAIGSSFWPYYARLHEPWIVPEGQLVMVPTAYAEHPSEILTPPRSLAESVYGNIQRWTCMPRGGHFPALECPDDLAADIRTFFRTIG
jgi:pimeloyl-ACP methyl ester carboxylesterase